MTFTRTGDVDVNSLPDPGSLPPRVVSPAEALHGHYHQTINFSNGAPNAERDVAVRTDCLRTGDGCMSYFEGGDYVAPLVFGGGKWEWDQAYDAACPSGGTSHVRVTAEFALPQPSQDPITLLAGNGHDQETGSACASGDITTKFVRTGD